MIMKILKILFYTFYSWLHKRSDTAKYQSVFAICIITFINIISIPVLIKFIFSVEIFILPEISKLYLALFFIAYYLVYYRLLLYKNKYISIIKEFKNESRNETRKRNSIVFVYIILSHILLFAPWYILAK